MLILVHEHEMGSRQQEQASITMDAVAARQGSLPTQQQEGRSQRDQQAVERNEAAKASTRVEGECSRERTQNRLIVFGTLPRQSLRRRRGRSWHASLFLFFIFVFYLDKKDFPSGTGTGFTLFWNNDAGCADATL